ncbi:hypothetical protein D3C80_2155910 [compost metagenome]
MAGVHRGVKTAGIRKRLSSPAHWPEPKRRATSSPSAASMDSVGLVSTRTARSGLASWKAPSRVASHWVARV